MIVTHLLKQNGQKGSKEEREEKKKRRREKMEVLCEKMEKNALKY